MLEKMHQQIPPQKQQRAFAPRQFQALGNHFDQRCGQHESRAQCNKISQVAAVPALLHDDRAAENIGRGSRQAKQDAEYDGIHGQRAG